MLMCISVSVSACYRFCIIIFRLQCECLFFVLLLLYANVNFKIKNEENFQFRDQIGRDKPQKPDKNNIIELKALNRLLVAKNKLKRPFKSNPMHL